MVTIVSERDTDGDGAVWSLQVMSLVYVVRNPESQVPCQIRRRAAVGEGVQP
jgi:hypothetical protein